jgi:predicted nucleic acid-binding protein
MVVSNASPLIILSKLGQFDLLPRLFTEVIIAPEVWDEVVVNGTGLPGSTEVQQALWIRLESVTNAAQLVSWQVQYNLGLGELATILLAKELTADLALIDERRARLLARAEGVAPFGTVGMLELGYRKGEIIDLRQMYQSLLTVGARVDGRVLNQSLAACSLPPL